jgi:hypothetical protein
MGSGHALEARLQLARCCHSSMRSPDHPAVAFKPIIALDAYAGNTVLNATALGMFMTGNWRRPQDHLVLYWHHPNLRCHLR